MSERPKLGDTQSAPVIDRDLRPFGPEVPVPIGSNGRVRWGLLKAHPAMLQAAIQTEARRLYAELGSLDRDQLKPDGQHLIRGAVRYYPGGIKKLKRDLGMVRVKTAVETPEPVYKPKSYWKSPDNIRREAAEIMQAHGELTQNTMRMANRTTISNAIRESYPGGLAQLHRDLGVRGRKKSVGYWTAETIEREARAFVGEHGEFSVPALKAAGRLDLCVAIQKKYPGGLRAIQGKFEIQPGHKLGYWTKEKIEEEARAFIKEYGALTQKLLLKEGRSDLHSATKAYPGKLTGLKKELGLEVVEVNKGVRGLSSDEKKAYLEQQARELIEKGHVLTNSQLTRKGQRRFLSSVQKNYPGGLAALQHELGINPKPQLSAEEANKALESLFGGMQ